MTAPTCCGAPMWGHEVYGVYDGVLYYQCPTCQTRAHRFAEGDWRHRAALRFVVTDPPPLTTEAPDAL